MSEREPGHKEYKYLYRQMLSEDVIRKAYKKLRKAKPKGDESGVALQALPPDGAWCCHPAGNGDENGTED